MSLPKNEPEVERATQERISRLRAALKANTKDIEAEIGHDLVAKIKGLSEHDKIIFLLHTSIACLIQRGQLNEGVGSEVGAIVELAVLLGSREAIRHITEGFVETQSLSLAPEAEVKTLHAVVATAGLTIEDRFQSSRRKLFIHYATEALEHHKRGNT